METAIRWSQNCSPSDRRLLYVDVAGRTLKLCNVDNIVGNGIQYHTISEVNRVPQFRAFDWSAQDEALVALGQPSGEVTVINIENKTQNLFPLPLKNQRQCNAVALNTQGLLAVGLDKVRSDYSLNVWDLNHRPILSPVQSPNSAGHTVEASWKFAHSEPITSIKFSGEQPSLVVAGVKGQWVRLYDLRESHNNAVLQFATRCVHNIAIDYRDENYLASCVPVNDATICVWDKRSGSSDGSYTLGYSSSGQTTVGQAALELKNAADAQGTIWSLRFSKTRRGHLGMMTSTGQLRIYDMVKDTASDGASELLQMNRLQDIHKPYYDATHGRGEKERVVSFDSMTENVRNGEPQILAIAANGELSVISPLAPGGPLSFSPRAALVRPLDDHPAVFEVESPSFDLSSDVAKTLHEMRSRIKSQKEYYRTARPFLKRRSDVSTDDLDLHGINLLGSSMVFRQRCISGYRFSAVKNKALLCDFPGLQQLWSWIEHARASSDAGEMTYNRLDLSYLGVHALWMDDVGSKPLEKRRVGQGTGGSPPIAKTIEGLSKQYDLPEQKMRQTAFAAHRRICLRVIGLALSWAELDRKIEVMLRSSQHTKAAFVALLSSSNRRAAEALRADKQNESQSGTNRMLAMAIAGMSRRQRRKHGQSDTADQRSSESPDSDSDSDSWTSTIESMRNNTSDPYALAILSFTLAGSWAAVINESRLPLKYRVGAALRWLPDHDLNDFISKQTGKAIAQGNIEGIVLTGLGSPGAVQLMENYIRCSGDVQTAVLALAHAVPRYVDNQAAVDKFEAWKETYRQVIMAWDLKFERVKFDIDSSKLCVGPAGVPATRPHKQLSVVCEYCSQPIAHHPRPPDALPSGGDSGMEVPTRHRTQRHPLTPEKAAAIGTICPKCGRHLPRCGVCDHWLGMPDPTYLRHGAEKYLTNKKATDTNGHLEDRIDQEKETQPLDSVGKYQEQKERQRHMEEVMANFVTFCIRCNHGFHAAHALEWFGPRSSFAKAGKGDRGRADDPEEPGIRRRVCPVVECDCVCDRA